MQDNEPIYPTQSGNTIPPAAQLPSDPATPQPTTVVVPPPDKPKRFTKKKLLFLVVLIVLIAGAIGMTLQLSKHPAPQPAVSKKDIALLRVGYGGGEVPKYPVSLLASAVDLHIASQLFEGLVGYEDQTKVVPLLATSWSNPNGTTWLFNLRQSVKFHSGRAMTAADVKYSLDYAVAHQNDDDGNSILLFAKDIKQVDVVSPSVVKVTTNNPDPVLLSQLSVLGIVDSKATVGDYNAGTGPYIVKSGTTPTDSAIDLVAVNDYWGGHVYTREVVMTIDGDEAHQAKDAADGKYDLVGDFNNSELSAIKNKQLVEVPSQGLRYLTLNTLRTGSPFQSLAARQAAAYALDIPAILKAGQYKGEEAGQLVPQLLPGHDPSIQKTAYDPEKAKALLATVKNANAPITYAYPDEGSPAVANEEVRQLKAVGFNITMVPVSDFGDFLVQTTAGKYDIFGVTETSNYVDGQDILSTILTGNKDYDNPTVDSLVDQVGSTFDRNVRIKKMQEVAKIVDAEKPVIPVYSRTRIFALTKPYIVKVDMPSVDNSIYYWKVYQR